MFAHRVGLFNLIIIYFPCVCMDVCPSHTTHAQSISAARAAVEAPYFALRSPLPASKTVLSSSSLVVICALIARGKFRPELEFQAGTSSFHALYTYENIGYVDVPEDVRVVL